jgi:hypothetical protein
MNEEISRVDNISKYHNLFSKLNQIDFYGSILANRMSGVDIGLTSRPIKRDNSVTSHTRTPPVVREGKTARFGRLLRWRSPEASQGG